MYTLYEMQIANENFGLIIEELSNRIINKDNLIKAISWAEEEWSIDELLNIKDNDIRDYVAQVEMSL